MPTSRPYRFDAIHTAGVYIKELADHRGIHFGSVVITRVTEANASELVSDLQFVLSSVLQQAYDTGVSDGRTRTRIAIERYLRDL